MPWSNRYSAASSTSTSPASDATMGLWMPLARISSITSTIVFANTIGGVMIGWHRHQRQLVVDARIRQQHAGTAGAGDDHDVLALRRRQHRNRAGVFEQV